MTLQELTESLKARAHNTYLEYLSLLKRDDCVGECIKMELGTFGQKELEAHKLASEKLGRYRALIEIKNMLDTDLKKDHPQPSISEKYGLSGDCGHKGKY